MAGQEQDFPARELVAANYLSSTEGEELLAWWREANVQETLLEFLKNHDMVPREAVRAFCNVQKGYLANETAMSMCGGVVGARIRTILAERRDTVRTEEIRNEDLSDVFGSVQDSVQVPDLKAKSDRDLSGAVTTISVPDYRAELAKSIQAATRKGSSANTEIPTVREDVYKPSILTETSIPSVAIDQSNAPTKTSQSSTNVGTSTPSAPLEMNIGAVLGRCTLLQKVGRGSSGVVYRGIHQTLEISVAIKILEKANFEANPQLLVQMKSEARLLAQLNHPNVIRIFDFDEKPIPYLVLEFVEGLSLAELIDQSGGLRANRAVTLMKQAAEGLLAASKLGIIHRDVKPANLLVTREGALKVADLGLARYRSKKGNSETGGAPVGTIAYMSPEQAYSPGKVDHRSDLYSLGATFYHAVTGRRVFPAKTLTDAMLKLMKEEPIPAHELTPGLDRRFSQLLMNLLVKRPEGRLPSYEALLELLDGFRPTGSVD